MTKGNPVFTYLRESKEELEKVSWPTRQETIRYSIIIIIITIAAAVFFGVLDFTFNEGVNALIDFSGESSVTAPAPTNLPEGIEINDIQSE